MIQNNINKNLLYILLFSFSLALLSCGGGNKSTKKAPVDNTEKEIVDKEKPKATKTTPIAITRDNAPYIAHRAFELGLILADLPSDFENPAGVVIASNKTVTKNNDIELLAPLLSCIGGGTLRHPDPFLFVGTYVFDACVEGEVTTTGSYVISGIGDYFNFKGSVIYNNLSKTSRRRGTVRTTGGYELIIISDATQEDFTLTGTSLRFASAFDISELVNINVKNYKSSVQNYARSSISYTLNSDTSKLLGSVNVSTIAPFITPLDSVTKLPKSGQGIVYGADNSKVQLTVQGGQGRLSDTVKIEVDTDGKGFDPALERIITWQDLILL